MKVNRILDALLVESELSDTVSQVETMISVIAVWNRTLGNISSDLSRLPPSTPNLASAISAAKDARYAEGTFYDKLAVLGTKLREVL